MQEHLLVGEPVAVLVAVLEEGGQRVVGAIGGAPPLLDHLEEALVELLPRRRAPAGAARGPAPGSPARRGRSTRAGTGRSSSGTPDMWPITIAGRGRPRSAMRSAAVACRRSRRRGRGRPGRPAAPWPRIRGGLTAPTGRSCASWRGSAGSTRRAGACRRAPVVLVERAERRLLERLGVAADGHHVLVAGQVEDARQELGHGAPRAAAAGGSRPAGRPGPGRTGCTCRSSTSPSARAARAPTCAYPRCSHRVTTGQATSWRVLTSERGDGELDSRQCALGTVTS